MKVGVLGDTHGKIEKAEKAIEQMGDIELLLHTGDHYADALALENSSGIKVKGVVGNCDGFAPGPVEELFEIQGVTIYLTHGHLFGVKYGLTKLKTKARELGAQIVIFGHTHLPYQDKKDDILFLNPGSITFPRFSGEHSFAIVDFQEGSYNAKTSIL